MLKSIKEPLYLLFLGGKPWPRPVDGGRVIDGRGHIRKFDPGL